MLLMKILFSFELFLFYFVSSEKVCKEELSATTTAGTFAKWPEIRLNNSEPSRFSSSDPKCLNENGEEIFRLCTKHGWSGNSQLPLCHNAESNGLLLSPAGCPPGFVKYKNLCILISDPAAWSNSCLKWGTSAIIFDYLPLVMEFFGQSNLMQPGEFWIPAFRFNDFRSIVWELPGPRWHEVIPADKFSEPVNFDNTKNCLSVKINDTGVVFEMDDCQKIFRMICLHPFLDGLFMQLACPPGSGVTTRFYGFQDRCLSTQKKTSPCQKLKSTPYEKFILYYESQKMKLNNVQRVSESVLALSFDDLVVCEKKIVLLKPQLSLKFSLANQTYPLTLSVTNDEYLWKENKSAIGVKCFKSSDMKIIDSVDVKLMDRGKIYANYALNITSNYSGLSYYWCGGHAIPNFTNVGTAKIAAYQNSEDEPLLFTITFQFEDSQWNKFTNLIQLEDYLYQQGRNVIRKIDNTALLPDRVVMSIEVTFPQIKSADILTDQKMPSKIIKLMEVRKWLLSVLQPKTNLYKTIDIQAAEYCLPNSLSATNEWESAFAAIGNNVTVRNCSENFKIPITRSCVRGEKFSSEWLTSDSDYLEYLRLCPLGTMKAISEKLSSLVEITARRDTPMQAKVTSFDEFLWKISLNSKYSKWSLEEVTKMTMVLSNIITDDGKKVLQEQETSGTMSFLWETWQEITTDKLIMFSKESATANISVLTPNIQMHAINPEIVTGIALFRPNNKTNSNLTDLSNYSIQFLNASQSVELLMADSNLEMASFIPADLLASIKVTSNLSRIVIGAILNDHALQENKEFTETKAKSRILSLSLIPSNLGQLSGSFPMIFRVSNLTSSDVSCGSWDIEETDDQRWYSDHCRVNMTKRINTEDSLVFCECNKLSKSLFSAFINDYFLTADNDKKQRVNVVFIYDDKNTAYTNIRSQFYSLILPKIYRIMNLISLICLVGILVTGILFKSWRTKSGSKLLIHLTIALSLKTVLRLYPRTVEQYLFDAHNEPTLICHLIGITRHFLLLSTFSWSLIIAYLQFMRYYVVLHSPKTSHLILKSIIIGWIIPLVLVLIYGVFFMDSYSNTEACCSPTGDLNEFGALWPVIVIVSVNTCLFVLISGSLIVRRCCSRFGPVNQQGNKKCFNCTDLKLMIFLYFLLDITHFNTVVAYLVGFDREILVYFFHVSDLSSPCQGIIIFLFFIILDPATIKLYLNCFKKCCPFDKKPSNPQPLDGVKTTKEQAPETIV